MKSHVASLCPSVLFAGRWRATVAAPTGPGSAPCLSASFLLRGFRAIGRRRRLRSRELTVLERLVVLEEKYRSLEVEVLSRLRDAAAAYIESLRVRESH